MYIDEGSRGYDRFPHLDARHQIPGLGMAAQSANFMKKKHGEKENEAGDDPGEVMQVSFCFLLIENRDYLFSFADGTGAKRCFGGRRQLY